MRLGPRLPASRRRDRALLLFGFIAALRRSELAALQVEDVAIAADGLKLSIRRGKTDQTGQGAEIGLPPSIQEATPASAGMAVAKISHGATAAANALEVITGARSPPSVDDMPSAAWRLPRGRSRRNSASTSAAGDGS